MLPKIKRTAGKLNLRDENKRDAKRQKIENRSPGTTIPRSPLIVPKDIVLLSSQQYSIEIEGLGQMDYKDGWFRVDGRPRTDLGLNDGRFITNAKVIIRDSQCNQILNGGGIGNQVISLQMKKSKDEGMNLTVSLVQNSESEGYRFPAPPLEMKVGRNETVNVYGLRNVTITAGEGGHVVHSGIGYVLVNGKVQTVSSHGAGMVRVNGNVDEGLSLGGVTKLIVTGDVRGDIKANGVCFLEVFGRHLGMGKVQRSWLAKVKFLEKDGDRGQDDGMKENSGDNNVDSQKKTKENEKNEDDKIKTQAKENKEVETMKEIKENENEEKTDYDDLEEIQMDVISDDEDENDTTNYTPSYIS